MSVDPPDTGVRSRGAARRPVVQPQWAGRARRNLRTPVGGGGRSRRFSLHFTSLPDQVNNRVEGKTRAMRPSRPALFPSVSEDQDCLGNGADPGRAERGAISSGENRAALVLEEVGGKSSRIPLTAPGGGAGGPTRAPPGTRQPTSESRPATGAGWVVGAGLVAVRDRLGEPACGQRGIRRARNPVERGRTGAKIHLIAEWTGLPPSIGLSGRICTIARTLRLIRGVAPVRSRRGHRRAGDHRARLRRGG